jgi:hypothetical protein
LEFPDGFGSQIFEIKLVLDFVVALFFDNINNPFHMLTWKFSDVDAEFFLFGQSDVVVRRVRFFWFAVFLDLAD